MNEFDICVIGAGSAGVRFARMAASNGKKVAVIESYRAGGTCVIRGCVPKKLYVYASRMAHDFTLAESFGWDIQVNHFSWKHLVQNKEKEITRLEGIYQKLLKNSGVTFIQDKASFKDANHLRLEHSNETLKADHIIIATGGKPRAMHIDGHYVGMASNEIFDLESLPKQIFIYGAGYIALEFASILNGLGVDVTVGFRGDKILRGFDEGVRDHLTQAFTDQGITLCPSLPMDQLSFDGHLLSFNHSGNDYSFEHILNATGRVPNIEDLNLESVGVATNKKGAICVDDYSATNIKSIYALGDVTDRMALTPVAIEEAMCLVDTLCHNMPRQPDYENIPTAVFTSPEIGTIGMTEQDVIAHQLKADIYESSFRPMKYTLSGQQKKMFMKCIVDQDTQKILGIHIVGPDSGEMIQALGIAVKAGLTKKDFDSTMAVHPTAAEELVTMRQKTRTVG